MIRVLLDAHQLASRQTGNETYVRELLREFRSFGDLRIIAAVERAAMDDGLLGPPVHRRMVPSNGLGRLAALTAIARREPTDVVHAIYFLPPGTGRPTVLTVHDISYERHPEFFGRGERFRDRLLIRASARAAAKVVTVSETSRRDLLEIYGLAEDQVVAIPNGVGPSFTPAAGWMAYSGGRPFQILAVGTLQPRKNLVRLVEAVERVSAEIPVSLRIVGPPGYQAARIQERLARSTVVDLVGWLSDVDLADAYRAADAFVYPSLYEGFGLPVVEAMACGTPVVTSNRGSLPEVAGDAALLVEPEDVDAITSALRRIAEDAGIARSMHARGLDRAASFSWSSSAARHVGLYREVAG